MKKATIEPLMSRDEFKRRASALLAELQKTLMPEHAEEFLAINVDTGEHLLGLTWHEVWQEVRKRWRGHLAYFCRVDGGPVLKFHGIA